MTSDSSSPCRPFLSTLHTWNPKYKQVWNLKTSSCIWFNLGLSLTTLFFTQLLYLVLVKNTSNTRGVCMYNVGVDPEAFCTETRPHLLLSCITLPFCCIAVLIKIIISTFKTINVCVYLWGKSCRLLITITFILLLLCWRERGPLDQSFRERNCWWNNAASKIA